jgi:hypothetical protein
MTLITRIATDKINLIRVSLCFPRHQRSTFFYSAPKNKLSQIIIHK